MKIDSERNDSGGFSLDFKLEIDDVLDFEEIRIIRFIGSEKYKFYSELAEKDKFNDIPYNYIRGYVAHPLRLSGYDTTGVRLREHFRERYNNKNIKQQD